MIGKNPRTEVITTKDYGAQNMRHFVKLTMRCRIRGFLTGLRARKDRKLKESVKHYIEDRYPYQTYSSNPEAFIENVYNYAERIDSLLNKAWYIDDCKLKLPLAKVKRVVEEVLQASSIPLVVLEEDHPGMAKKVNERGKWQAREFRLVKNPLVTDGGWWLKYYGKGERLKEKHFRGKISLMTVERIEFPCLYGTKAIIGLKLVFPGRVKTDGGLVLKFEDADARDMFLWKLRRVAPKLPIGTHARRRSLIPHRLCFDEL